MILLFRELTPTQQAQALAQRPDAARVMWQVGKDGELWPVAGKALSWGIAGSRIIK